MIASIVLLKARPGLGRAEVTQMKFADEAARRAWLALVLAEGSGVAEDEARFLDRSATRSWVVEEHVSA